MKIELKGNSFDITIEGTTRKELEEKAEFVKNLIENAYYGMIVEIVDAERAEADKEEIKKMNEKREAYYKEARKVKEAIRREMEELARL